MEGVYWPFFMFLFYMTLKFCPFKCNLFNASVERTKDGMSAINDGISKGKLKILKKGTIIRTDDDSFYLQGGSTYDQTYWWGKRRYMSTDRANQWNRDFLNLELYF